jgi:hypothetical protein
MGFLKDFFATALKESKEVSSLSSFEELSEGQLESHLGVDRYGEFQLTDAVRPSYDLKVVPRQGYRHEIYREESTSGNVPVVMASVSKERLFDVFMDLLDPLGNTVDVVLETSHDQSSRQHTDLLREHIDVPVLKSILWDYEELLTNDGCTGIAILNPQIPHEIQFDEHKLLMVYGNDLSKFEAIFNSYVVECDEELQFVTEAEHVHSSNETFAGQFHELKARLGMDMQF